MWTDEFRVHLVSKNPRVPRFLCGRWARVSLSAQDDLAQARFLEDGYDIIVLREPFNHYLYSMMRHSTRTPYLVISDAPPLYCEHILPMSAGEMEFLEAVSRLVPKARAPIVRCQDWVLFQYHNRLWMKDREVRLWGKLSRLLATFMNAEGDVLSTSDLMKRVWDIEGNVKTRTVKVHIHWLRRQLDDLRPPTYIKTIRGQGYQFRLDGSV